MPSIKALCLALQGSLLLTLAFASTASHAETKGASGSSTGEIVAYVDSQPIARGELEAHLEAPLRQLEIEKQQLLERGLAQLVEQRLLGLEAEKRGLDVGALLEAETRGLSVDEAAVDAFYAANQARIGQPKEQVAPQIRRYLEQQQMQQRRAELLGELRAAYEVSVLLEPYRASLPWAGDAVPTRGSVDAPVTLTVFSDFQCPGCRGIEPVLDAVREANGEKLKLVFRQYPLTSIHPQAFQAAEAALCAGEQEKFWPMHASLFADQRRLSRADLERRAETLELDQSAFTACLDAGEKKAQVKRDMQLGRELGISSTPTLYVNGRPVDLGNLQGSPQDAIQALIDDELSRSAG